MRKLTPSRLTTISGVAAVGAGSAHSIAIKNDGSVLSWGDNSYGQLGNTSKTDSIIPVSTSACVANPTIPGPARSSMAGRIAAAQNFSFGVSSADALLSWGENANGQLGDGTKINHASAVTAAGLSDAASVAAGFYHGLLVRNNGSVASWGYNGYGELGDGTSVDRITPITVPNLSSVVAVAAGRYHSASLRSDGTVWTWGYNGYGQLGDGTRTNRNSPVRVLNLDGVVSIAAGDNRTYALKNDGTVWAWGDNSYGELGDSTVSDSLLPVRVANLTGVVAIAASSSHCLALKNDGTVWAWGYGANGQLGEGATTWRNNAVRASGLSNVVAIAGGDSHSLAVESDGSVWSWGYNATGQLGNGSSVQSLVPVRVSGLNNAIAVAAGSAHSLALLKDGSMAAWGSNAKGQFGAGTASDSTVPVHGPAGTPFGPIYNVTLNSGTPGAGSLISSYPSPDGNYTVGRRVCFGATPQVGYYFNGFSGSTLDSSGCLTVNASGVVTANYTNLAQLRFIPTTPCRIADTRGATGTFGGPILPAQTSRDFPIPQGNCNIPSNAAAYSLNVTVVPEEPLIYLTAWPAGTPQPNASVLNSFDGRIKANAAIVPAGSDGAISIYVQNRSHVILDINGYFVSSSDANALAFYPLPPCRISDTRSTAGPLGGPGLSGGQARTIPILMSDCGIPARAKAYSLNMTSIPNSTLGYLSVWPAGESQPFVSTLNSGTGAVTANAAIVPAGAAG